jgi:hypothetical protein
LLPEKKKSIKCVLNKKKTKQNIMQRDQSFNFDIVSVTSDDNVSSRHQQHHKDDDDQTSNHPHFVLTRDQSDPSEFHHQHHHQHTAIIMRNDPFLNHNNSAPLLRKFAKRAILSRVERVRQEQVAQKASELLVQAQHQNGGRNNNTSRRENNTNMYQNPNNGSSFNGGNNNNNLQTQGSFFCGRMSSYSDFSRSLQQTQQNRRQDESGVFSPADRTGTADFGRQATISSSGNFGSSPSFGNYSITMMNASQQQQFREDEKQQQQSSSAPMTVDVTFQALLDELRDSIPQSGLPTPDIALIMDRLLGRDVPVHFISSLQKLRHVLREVTRISRSIRRHVELHGDCMAELAEVLDEDAEDEERAREEIEEKERLEREEAKKKRRRERKAARAAKKLEKQQSPKNREGMENIFNETVVSGDFAESDFGEENENDDDEGENETEKKPAWVGNVPRLRTVRPRQELLEKMSQLVQRADAHTTRIIDDVTKWRKHANCPLPFFHDNENVRCR